MGTASEQGTYCDILLAAEGKDVALEVEHSQAEVVHSLAEVGVAGRPRAPFAMPVLQTVVHQQSV